MQEPIYIDYFPDSEYIRQKNEVKSDIPEVQGYQLIESYPDENIKIERWYAGKVLHRSDGPAFIYYLQTGKVFYESWWFMGYQSRVVYPSFIRYSDDGNIQKYHYFNCGFNITDQVKEYLNEHDLRDPFDIPVEHSIIMKMKFW